ncbi:MAG: SMC-Scp complex subunit ScpB [Bdellovibrionales bacterium]|nr:SMC-Scp complex subunit ScpB [Bdellovibrionales bacterium]
MPETIELRFSHPISIELKTPPTMEILPVLDWLAAIPEIKLETLPAESISPPSENPESPLSGPFSPGLTTEITDDVTRAVSALPKVSLQEESLPMAVGMPIETPNLEVAMSPKKTKNENETIAPTGAAEPSLESAASEWAADPVATGHASESESGSVTLLADPSGADSSARKAMDVAEAQKSDEPLDLDGDLADLLSEDLVDSEESEDDSEPAPLDDDLAPLALADDETEIAETLERLQEKMTAQDAELAKEAAEVAEANAAQAKERLAAEIAEDEALEKAMKEEAEDDLANDPELRAALPREPEESESGELDLREMESCIEALLFMSERPLSANKLRELLGPEMSLHYFQEALTNLQARYARFSHGIELAEIAHGYQFRTKPIRAPLAKKLAKIQTQRLSTGAMESLAIVAYKQPVLKDDIDKIRGVDSSHFIRGLLDKKLIKIVGRSELPGRPMLYATTNEFLEIFSLKSLDALPPLKELESMIPGSQSGNPDDADPRVKKMRELVSQMNSDHSVSLLYDPKEDEKFLTDIRERVKSIEINTPTLQAQAEEADLEAAIEKARAQAIAEGRLDEQAENFAAAVEETKPGETAEMPIE